MAVLDRPGRVGLHECHRFLLWTAARQLAVAHRERAGSPLAQRADVRAAFRGQHVGVEMIAPGKQRDFHLQHGIAVRAERHMVERAILEAVCGEHLEFRRWPAEPEEHRIEQMRTEIGQHACALVAPRRFTHEARRAVAVKHPDADDFSKPPRIYQFLHSKR